MRLDVRPLTPDLWPALEDLFAGKSPCQRCWCMYWRIGALYRKQPAAHNKAEFFKIVQQGPPPGLLAFAEELPVGWCQLTPRSALPWLDEHTWRLRRVDDVPVWAISCFYIRIGFRKKGVTSALIEAAIREAKRAHVPALEAYPLDAEQSPSATSTGYVTTFARLGFKTAARHAPERPIMRLDLR